LLQEADSTMVPGPLSVHCLPAAWVRTVSISKVALLSRANWRECRAFHISHCLSLVAADGERAATEKPVGRGANSEQGDARGQARSTAPGPMPP
jgi:hypothetical protein